MEISKILEIRASGFGVSKSLVPLKRAKISLVASVVVPYSVKIVRVLITFFAFLISSYINYFIGD
ncbi:hypothetical protein HpCK75_04500 [Helicobacter pylori]